jgi:hypothetical protein
LSRISFSGRDDPLSSSKRFDIAITAPVVAAVCRRGVLLSGAGFFHVRGSSSPSLRRRNAVGTGRLRPTAIVSISPFFGAHGLAGKTAERYRELAAQQIYPHIGTIPLQRLRPAHIADWHARLLQEGGENGRALSARTVGHAHRVLHRALARAAATELVSRNVASIVKPPRVEEVEIESLRGDQISSVLTALDGHPASTAIAESAHRAQPGADAGGAKIQNTKNKKQPAHNLTAAHCHRRAAQAPTSAIGNARCVRAGQARCRHFGIQQH